jgi:hypothetical protein
MATEPRHGSISTYANRGCRCEECRAVAIAYLKNYRATKKARGLCLSCRESAVEGRVFCAKHLALAREGERRRYQAKGPDLVTVRAAGKVHRFASRAEAVAFLTQEAE